MPDTDIETERQVRRLEEQFKRLSITDSEGDLETGFVISRFPTEAIGACCLGSDCQLLSARDCGNIGGIYQGDQSPCDPNPCAPICCDCPEPTRHVSVSVELSVTDNRPCPSNCGEACSVSASITQTGGEDNAEICNGQWNNELIGYNLTPSDGSASCGGSSLDISGTLIVKVAVFNDGVIEPCFTDGRVRLEANWQVNGHIGFTHLCGDDCIDNSTTWDTTEDYSISCVYQPQGTYVMTHTLTATDYSATVTVTAIIS